MAVKYKKRLLSIIVKDEEIKISELSKQSKGVKVHRAIAIQTPPGAVSDGVIENGQELAAVIKTAIDVNGITCRDVVFAVASGKIATKEVVIPDVKENKIADIVNTNASEYFPVNVEQYIIKHIILEKIQDNGEKKIKLQVVAVPSSIIDGYYELASTIGLRIHNIDYAGNSNFQILRQQITDEFSVVINIANDATVVSIFDKRTLQMQRTIPYGRDVLVNAVMDQFGIDNEQEALLKLQEEKLLHISFDGDELTESLKYLVSGINRITDYYISRNGSRHFEKAYIIGSASTVAGLVTLLANEINLELTVIEKLQNVILEDNNAYTEKQIVDFISNIGVLISPIGFTSKINLESESGGNGVRNMEFVLGAAALAALAITVVPLVGMLSVKGDIDKVKTHIGQMEYVEETVDEYYKAKDMMGDAAAFGAITQDSDDYLHIFLSELEKKIPSDVAFTGISVASGSVNISGTASGKSSLAKLVQQLGSINSVSNVYISNESEAEDNTGVITVTFSITCTFGTVTADGE